MTVFLVQGHKYLSTKPIAMHWNIQLLFYFQFDSSIYFYFLGEPQQLHVNISSYDLLTLYHIIKWTISVTLIYPNKTKT